MKNFRKLSPRRLKKLISNYQNLITSQQKEISWLTDSKQFYRGLFLDLCKKKTKDNKRCLYMIIFLTLIIILQGICYYFNT